MKNHEMINGKLLQTNKTFSNLKERQKENIAEWLYEYYKDHTEKNGKEPLEDVIVQAVYEKMEAEKIWLPSDELHCYYLSRKNEIRKRYEKAAGIGMNGTVMGI